MALEKRNYYILQLQLQQLTPPAFDISGSIIHSDNEASALELDITELSSVIK